MWLMCLPKCHVSFKVCTQPWTEFLIFRSGLIVTGLARVYCTLFGQCITKCSMCLLETPPEIKFYIPMLLFVLTDTVLSEQHWVKYPTAYFNPFIKIAEIWVSLSLLYKSLQLNHSDIWELHHKLFILFFVILMKCIKWTHNGEITSVFPFIRFTSKLIMDLDSAYCILTY
jgi:hypothetical protein